MEQDELQEYLNALGRSDCYRTDALLKDSAIERTERVFFVGNNGSEFGPFIRKTISPTSGQGRVYEMLYHAQQVGKRFAHLPRIFECYTTSDSLTVLIEYIQGSTLQEYVEVNGPSGNLAQRVFPLICDAASELHEAFDPPIIHRDLTPANIIVSESSVTLIDFGIARTFSPDAEHDTAYFGTRAYAPPEQFGFGQTDVRSDVYALGKVLRFCLIGGEGEKLQINARIAEVITKATALDPAQRYQSINELKAAFLAVCTQIAHEKESFTCPPPPAGSPVIVEASQSAYVPQPLQASRFRAEHQSLAQSQPATLPIESVTFRSAREPLGTFDRISRPFGIAWDVFIVFSWLIIFVAANASIIDPLPNSMQYPLWFLIVQYYGLIVLPSTIITYFLLDLRMLRDRYPNLKLPTRRKALPFAIIIIFVLVFAVVAIANYSGIVAPTS